MFRWYRRGLDRQTRIADQGLQSQAGVRLQSGNYVADVQVVIADAKGKTLLDATSAGPWFLANYRRHYQIVATFAGNAVKRTVTVGTANLQTVDFAGPRNKV